MVEEIIHENHLMAIIIREKFQEEGIHFFTPPEFSQQLAYMHHPAGKLIDPHIHNPVPREVHYTKEVLVIRKGKLKVDFYSDNQQYIKSRLLNEGDIILLSEGGHGFEVIEEVEMYEIKQGPYAGDNDKTRFKQKKEDINYNI